ncbi:MAG: hypothetical protein ACLPN6_06035 [Streptosporangiaceae bacterium]|jgi:hypothetical protein|nr:hypothetical protein [Actinomycetota bacterium]
MSVTTAPGLAGLQARMESEFGPRLMTQLPRLDWDAGQLAAHQTGCLRALLARRSSAPRSTPAASAAGRRRADDRPLIPARSGRTSCDQQQSREAAIITAEGGARGSLPLLTRSGSARIRARPQA